MTNDKTFDRSQIRRLVIQGASEELIHYIEKLREQNRKLQVKLAERSLLHCEEENLKRFNIEDF